MTSDEKLHFLAGEVNALRAFLISLANTHPNPRALLADFERLSELAIALANPIPTYEQFVEGQRQTIEELKNHLLERTKGV